MTEAYAGKEPDTETRKAIEEVLRNLDLDGAWFGVEKSRGHLDGLTLYQYRELLIRERSISENPHAQNVPVEEVVEDIRRYCARKTELLIGAFMHHTLPQTRKASAAGRDEQIVYLAVGDFYVGNKNTKFKLGLISAHTPGSSGAGGHGLNGTRRLVIGHNEKYLAPIDPEKWLENTTAYVQEDYDGALEYHEFAKAGSEALLRVIYERERASRKRGQNLYTPSS